MGKFFFSVFSKVFLERSLWIPFLIIVFFGFVFLGIGDLVKRAQKGFSGEDVSSKDMEHLNALLEVMAVQKKKGFKPHWEIHLQQKGKGYVRFFVTTAKGKKLETKQKLSGTMALLQKSPLEWHPLSFHSVHSQSIFEAPFPVKLLEGSLWEVRIWTVPNKGEESLYRYRRTFRVHDQAVVVDHGS